LLMSLIGAAIILIAGPPRAVQPYHFELQFSTCFGSHGDCRGMAVDAQGNVYLGAASWGPDWPTTPGAYDSKFHGQADMAISKWSPDGKLIWSTLIGSPGHDRPYSIKVDKEGYVYVGGLGGVGMPTSPDAFEPNPLGNTDNEKKPHEEYVGSNGYVVKLSPDGSKVIWGSYVGNHLECRDLALDDEGNLYLTFGYWSKAAHQMPESWFKNAYCKTHHGDSDLGIMKVSNDGKHVFWATYIGGTGGNQLEGSIAVGPDHCPIVATGTHSTDMETTPGAFSSTPNSTWMGKFSADGSKLIFGTYIGDGKGALPRTHDVALDPQGNIFLGLSPSGNWPVTPGAFQTRYGGGKGDFGIAKFSPTGKLLAATYLGGSGDEVNGPDTVSVDKHGNVLITGGYALTSTDYPVTPGCFQPKHGGGSSDGVVSLLSNDLSALLYSTYMGGSGGDNLRANAFGPDGSIYVAGSTGSPNWPTKNAFQKPKDGSIVLAKFTRVLPAAGDRGGR
jgi:hypothetical protein